MSVSKKRKSKARTKRGRSHQAPVKPKLIKCSKCGKPTLPHHVCPFCGSYQGKEIVKLKVKKSKVSK